MSKQKVDTLLQYQLIGQLTACGAIAMALMLLGLKRVDKANDAPAHGDGAAVPPAQIDARRPVCPTGGLEVCRNVAFDTLCQSKGR